MFVRVCFSVGCNDFLWCIYTKNIRLVILPAEIWSYLIVLLLCCLRLIIEFSFIAWDSKWVSWNKFITFTWTDALLGSLPTQSGHVFKMCVWVFLQNSLSVPAFFNVSAGCVMEIYFFVFSIFEVLNLTSRKDSWWLIKLWMQPLAWTQPASEQKQR